MNPLRHIFFRKQEKGELFFWHDDHDPAEEAEECCASSKANIRFFEEEVQKREKANACGYF